MDRSNGLVHSDLYVLYSISNSPYQLWQADLLDFSAREVNQPGTVVRLCSRDAGHPSLELRSSATGYTFETPSFAELGNSWIDLFVGWIKRRLALKAHGRYHFFCLNKPYAMRAFLQAHPSLDDEARLLWLDPDMVFNRPYSPSAKDVKRGYVHGQRWWGFDRHWCLGNAGSKHEAATPAEDEAVMFPFCISVADMRRISDIFCHLSTTIYRKTRDWKSEMCALVLALGTARLKCSTVSTLGTCNNWPAGLPDDPDAPISHYTQPMVDSSGTMIWDKRSYTAHTLSRPWGRPPDPRRAATLTDQQSLTMLHTYIDRQETQAAADSHASPHGRRLEAT